MSFPFVIEGGRANYTGKVHKKTTVGNAQRWQQLINCLRDDDGESLAGALYRDRLRGADRCWVADENRLRAVIVVTAVAESVMVVVRQQECMVDGEAHLHRAGALPMALADHSRRVLAG